MKLSLAVVLGALLMASCTRGAVPTNGAASLHGDTTHSGSRPHFTLVDTTGTPYDFYQRTKGHATLLFWGYTHCPDTCPATMHSIALALRRVPAAVRDRVRVVFVTTDPARDTPGVVRRWLDRIDPSFVGLTGTPAQLAAAERAAGVPPAQRSAPMGGGYTVDHYAGTTAFGRDDRVAVVYSTTAGARDFAADLPVLVREESPK